MKDNIVNTLYEWFQPLQTEWLEVQDCIVNTDWDHVARLVSEKLEGVKRTV
jgi:hypothetical protein